MRLVDYYDPQSPVTLDVPDDIATSWLTNSSRFRMVDESPPVTEQIPQSDAPVDAPVATEG